MRKKGLFHYVGDNVRLPQMLLPLHCELISIHNNVEIASGVKLIPHDAIHSVMNGVKFPGGDIRENVGCIEIMDNVFIGAGTIVLGDVRIGPNAVVGAGSVINKDVPPGTVYAGVPAKQIGTFDKLYAKRKEITCYDYDDIWNNFETARK